MEDLTGVCVSTAVPWDAHNPLMVGLSADIKDRFDDLEDSFAAIHDKANGPSDGKDTIEQLERELEYQNSKIQNMRDAK